MKAHLDDPASRREQIMGRFDRLRLGGASAYEHAPASAGCRDGKTNFKATDHTRVSDAKGRPAGLPANEGFYLGTLSCRRRARGAADED